ncbi:unnamed protein product [Diamesa tonsa]
MGRNNKKCASKGRNGGGNRGGSSRGPPRDNRNRHDNTRMKRTGNDKEDWQTKSRLYEHQVGITEYVSTCKGFTGIIKSRYSDFHVNEVDPSGEVAILTDITVPKKPAEKAYDENTDLKSVITEAEVLKIKEMVENTAPDADNKFVMINVTTFEKDARTQLHKLLKSEYGTKIVSSTVADSENKFIRISKSTKNDPKRSQPWLWPFEYTYFVLHKENMDTMQAISVLASSLNTRPSQFVYAGTKDKRAKTSQWVCIKRTEPAKIAGAVKRVPNLHVGNFTFKPKPLRLGELIGNQFQIALRSVTADESAIEESLKSLRDSGFINYYGMQRFGNCFSVPTYEVGLALLQSDFKLACDLILKERDGDPPFMNEMRQVWASTGNAEEALKKLYSSNVSIEARLLKGLVETGEKNYVEALKNIPRNMRQLYTHAYQSLIWNTVVSRRIKEYGSKLIVGDLVLVERDAPVTELNVEEAAAVEIDEDTPEIEESKFKSLARPLTKEDIASGKYSFYDMVLPLPGFDIKYPNNSVADIYRELLEKDGLSSEKLKTNNKDYSLGGAYRKVFIKPEKLSWSFKNYTDQDSNLILSDIEKHNKVTETKYDGTLKSLVLNFFLPSSTYATMLLRELLKEDTSVGNQIALENKTKVVKPTEEVNSEKRKLDDEPEVTESKKIKI